MLDLDNLQTQYIFEASGLEDALKARAQQMSVLPSAKRWPLLEQCHLGLGEMRRLNREHFGNSAFIAQSIAEAEIALNNLAHAGGGSIVADNSHGDGQCAVCGTAISKFEVNIGSHHRTLISCDSCLEPWWPVEQKLSSPAGFGTCFI